ncbi:hypothetical protein EMIHUDRAFT_352461 [Emiliania huxleyi CCMP1516]|uniref:RRM domain-containing protein n=2 Tax=Emiliania huxleyi TaxID=2903 RepID=A0A0D3KBT2_EMIH1|nr:hypothetical protein EMIHUDRAFT_352461 [Emiliania huxleyi CCMP1516]EOD33217.1 hypothetical protein EMIHUDRAFT_352461 [Emiliania huxleyi CCMP1516]|eukprot:XP_005785646.1 hypothetical protein EMIHUDRAFT_352461 [Emiliania huxleyi CCMP1516]
MTAGSTWTFVNGVKVTQVPGEAPASRSAPPVLLPAKHTPIMATGISAPKLELSGQHAAGHSGLPPPPPGTVFLSSIPEALDDAQLLQLICTFGDATSLQRALTFATFTYSEGDEMGQTAIYALNGLELGGASLAARKATAQDLAALRGSAELRDEANRQSSASLPPLPAAAASTLPTAPSAAPKPPANGGGAEGAPKPWVVELRGVVGDDTDADIAEQDVLRPRGHDTAMPSSKLAFHSAVCDCIAATPHCAGVRYADGAFFADKADADRVCKALGGRKYLGRTVQAKLLPQDEK